ncbi:FAD-dependent oxidoreductase [Nocardioides pacificus]
MPDQTTSPSHRPATQDYDVVVVGSGAGALTGAYLAARAGLRTLVLEKTDRLGGTSAYSGAAAWLPGTQVQERAGLADSTESARTYLRALLGDDHLEHQEAFVTTAPGLVARLEEDPHLAFEFQAFPDYFDREGRVPGGRSFIPAALPLDEIGERAALVRPPVDRDRIGKGHHLGQPMTQGRALIGRLLMALDATGNATVRTGAAVDRLVTDGDRVVGVEAVTGEGREAFAAARGVLLASGGFEHDDAMRREYGVPGASDWAMAPAGTNTGEPIRAAAQAGAALDLMDQGWWSPGLLMPDGTASFTLGFRGGIVVDAHGQRYANESLPYDQMGRAMAADPARVPSYLVFDQREGGRLPAISMPGGDPAEHLAAGTWQQADTLAELAGLIGVPPDALEASVERFNGFAAAGVDEDFGRGRDEFDNYFARPVLVPIDLGPFYAARLVLADLGTKGGAVTDIDARVLRADGSVIEGLYAAGNASASMTGGFYPGPGIPIGTAMVFASRAIDHLQR